MESSEQDKYVENANDFTVIGEPAVPSDQPDELTELDRESIEGTLTRRHAADGLRTRKYLEKLIDDLRSERDEAQQHCQDLQAKVALYNRLDDRRKSAWLAGTLAGIAGVGIAVASIWPHVFVVRVIGNTIAGLVAIIMILVSIDQSRKP